MIETEKQIDELWHKHIGSRMISIKGEIIALRRLVEEKTIPYDQIYLMYLTSKFWRMTRQKVLKRDGNRCVKCSSVHGLHVDHMRYPDKFGNEKLKDLQTLCYRCHIDKTKAFDLAAMTIKPENPVDVSGQLYLSLRRKE